MTEAERYFGMPEHDIIRLIDEAQIHKLLTVTITYKLIEKEK